MLPAAELHRSAKLKLNICFNSSSFRDISRSNFHCFSKVPVAEHLQRCDRRYSKILFGDMMLLFMRLYQEFNIDSTPATAPLHPWHALWKNCYAFVSFLQLNVWCIDGIFFHSCISRPGNGAPGLKQRVDSHLKRQHKQTGKELM
jgi:hypothetical protein